MLTAMAMENVRQAQPGQTKNDVDGEYNRVVTIGLGLYVDAILLNLVKYS